MPRKSLIIADIHANLAALEAIFEYEQTWDEVLFLGDAVMAGPHPNEVVSLLAQQEGFLLLGNHDREVLRVDCSKSETDPHRQWVQWTRNTLTKENLSVLREDFRETCPITRGALTIRLHHGDISLRSENRLWPDSSDEDFAQIANTYPEPYIFLAHSHIQFERHFEDRLFLNPGSAGHTRLGKPLSCYAVLSDGAILRRAIPYNVEKTCSALDSLPLERDFLEMWKSSFRTGTLGPRYTIRDFSTLKTLPDVN